MITVRLPDGREVDVDTDDPQQAAAAARKFAGIKDQPSAAPPNAPPPDTPPPPAPAPDRLAPGGIAGLIAGPQQQPQRGEPRGLIEEAGGALANFNRGIPLADEMAGAGFGIKNAIGDLMAGRPQLGIADRFKEGMAQQRGVEDDFAARRPLAAELAKGTGFATSAVVPGGAGAQAAKTSGVINGILKGGAVGAPQAYATALADRGTAEERLSAAPGAAMLGAAGGGALGGVGGVLESAAARPGFLQEAQAAAIAALRRMGVDPETLPPQILGHVRRAVLKGRDPEQAAAVAVGKTLPVPVPLTRGQMSGLPRQQLKENLALRGKNGDVAAAVARAFQGDQQAALRANVGSIADEMAGGAYQPGSAGPMVSGRLGGMREEMRGGVNAAYDEARSAPGAGLPLTAGQELGTRLARATASFDVARVPAVARELSRLDEMTGAFEGPNPGTLPIQALFDARSRLSALSSSTDSVEAAAAGAARRELDAGLKDALDQNLIEGNTDAVAAWRKAIAARREMGALFEGRDLIQALTEQEFRGGQRALSVAPEDAINYIFGRASLSGPGFAGKRNLSRDLKRMADVLGRDSEEWGALRAEAFLRIAGAAEGPSEHGVRQFSGAKLQKAWEDFQRRDPELAQTLFNPSDRQDITQLAAVAARVTSPVRGGDNPSNTAVTSHLIGRIPWLRAVAPFFRIIPGAKQLGEGYAIGNIRNATTRAQPAQAKGQGVSRPLYGRLGGTAAAALASE